jgi:hypothetical protein
VPGGGPYADPGYQADKKKRYPIDTKARAKAAWSYVSQADNARLYTSAQLKRIKQRIVKALKGFGVQVAAQEGWLIEPASQVTEALAECWGMDSADAGNLYVSLTNGPTTVTVSSYSLDPHDLDAVGRAAMAGAVQAIVGIDPDLDADVDVPGTSDGDEPASAAGGTVCPCGCGCAIPETPGACPCDCDCGRLPALHGRGRRQRRRRDGDRHLADPGAPGREWHGRRRDAGRRHHPDFGAGDTGRREPHPGRRPRHGGAHHPSGDRCRPRRRWGHPDRRPVRPAPRTPRARPGMPCRGRGVRPGRAGRRSAAPAAAEVTETEDQRIARLVAEGVAAALPAAIQEHVQTTGGPARKGLVPPVTENTPAATAGALPEDWPAKPLHEYTDEEFRQYVSPATVRAILGDRANS